MPETLSPNPSRRAERGDERRGETSSDGDTDPFGGRTPSREEAERYRCEIREAVESVRRKQFPPRDAIVWPGGIGRAMLLELPLPERTRTILVHTELMTGDAPLTGRDLLYAPMVNKRVTFQTVIAIDNFFAGCIEAVEDGPSAG